MEINFLAIADSVLTGLIYLLLSFALFLIGKKVYQLLHRNIKVDHELVEKDNLAFAFANVGYYAGLVIAISGVYAGDGISHILDSVIDILLYGGLSIVLLNASIFITDKVVLRSFSIEKEIITDRNVGTGVIEGAVCLANGLIIHGVLAENEDSFTHILMLWVLAQVMLILVGWVYNKMMAYDVHDHIEKDNIAVGIAYAGAIIAISNLIRFGAQMDAENWFVVGENMILETGIGLIMLPIARLLADKILLPGRKLTDELINQDKPNNGAALVEAFAYIGSSMLICISFS